jgi:single-strand DNA-binding protein
MNALRNKVSLIGRLGAQPEVVTLDSGVKLVTFSIATNERYKDKDGAWKDYTQWHNLKAWGVTADNVSKVLGKGDEVVVEGRLVNNTYESKSGEKRHATSVEVNEFLMISSKSDDAK